MVILVFKIIFLFLAVYFLLHKIDGVTRGVTDKHSTERMLLQTIGIVGFITLQFLY
jgi:hypothetical protein